MKVITIVAAVIALAAASPSASNSDDLRKAPRNSTQLFSQMSYVMAHQRIGYRR